MFRKELLLYDDVHFHGKSSFIPILLSYFVVQFSVVFLFVNKISDHVMYPRGGNEWCNYATFQYSCATYYIKNEDTQASRHHMSNLVFLFEAGNIKISL